MHLSLENGSKIIWLWWWLVMKSINNHKAKKKKTNMNKKMLKYEQISPCFISWVIKKCGNSSNILFPGQTCSQSWEGDRAELVLLADLQDSLDHFLNLRSIILTHDVDDVAGGKQTTWSHDHGTRHIAWRIHCREERRSFIKCELTSYLRIFFLHASDKYYTATSGLSEKQNP